jgi:hypothetical protein
MFRTKIFKNAKLNYKLYNQTVIVSNKPVKPYEVAESEEIDIRIVEEEKPKLILIHTEEKQLFIWNKFSYL